jgi:hypothetical protein
MATPLSDALKNLDLDKLTVGADGRPKFDGRALTEYLREQGVELPADAQTAASNWNACNASGCSGGV